MRILVAWADDSSPNLGVRVLGQGSRDLLQQIWPDAEFEFLNYGRRPESVPWRPRSLLKERVLGRHGMMSWLSSFDMVWDTRSGDSFTDIYGMHRHWTMSLIHEFAVQAGVRAIMAPQTIGPFQTRRARMLARRNLSRSSLVFARDAASAEASSQLGREVDLTATDMVFGLRQPSRTEEHDVLLNISGLLWNPNSHVDNEAYRRAVHTIVDELLSRGREVTLLSHVLDSADHDNDVPAVRAVQEHYGDAVRSYLPKGLDDARSVIASSRVVVGARMHACLNALSTGTPAIAMAYSRKFAPLLGALDWDHVVPLGDGARAGAAVLDALGDAELDSRALATQKRGQSMLAEMIPAISRVA
ncbi:polysaccharide pyruvyl transferase family protein [Microbacterium tumbae]